MLANEIQIVLIGVKYKFLRSGWMVAYYTVSYNPKHIIIPFESHVYKIQDSSQLYNKPFLDPICSKARDIE